MVFLLRTRPSPLNMQACYFRMPLPQVLRCFSPLCTGPQLLHDAVVGQFILPTDALNRAEMLSSPFEGKNSLSPLPYALLGKGELFPCMSSSFNEARPIISAFFQKSCQSRTTGTQCVKVLSGMDLSLFTQSTAYVTPTQCDWVKADLRISATLYLKTLFSSILLFVLYFPLSL